MLAQKERARSARANISGWSDASKSLLSEFPKTEFLGYTDEVCEAKVIGIIADDMSVNEVTEGEFSLITDRTVFYGEGGGQVGDTGTVYDSDTLVTVSGTQKTDGVFVHLCSIAHGDIKVGDTVKLEINSARRQAIKRNHSACHMLQAALRQVLGNHVEQAGSYVDDERLRFDFKHFAAMTTEEINKVENLVNSHIFLGECVETKEMSIEDARKTGAMALFGEKYGDTVRVVKMGNFSTELCGGTHLDNTAKAGLFKIVSESSVAAGVRRIEAVTGAGVLKLIKEKDDIISDTARELRANSVSDVVKKASGVMQELKEANREIEQLNAKIASSMVANINFTDVCGLNLGTGKMPGAAVDTVRSITDDFKAENDLSVTVIAVPGEGKVNFVASCGKEAVKRGAHAGNLLKQLSAICGGGGGGRPDSAQSGGKQPENVDKALLAAAEILATMIK